MVRRFDNWRRRGKTPEELAAGSCLAGAKMRASAIVALLTRNAKCVTLESEIGTLTTEE